MKPSRIDFIVDITYGVLLLIAIVLIVTIGTSVGIAFGLGAVISYIVHVVWKMSRFDPAWMTQEISENITEEVSETVGEQVAEEVTETVEEQVTETVEEQVTETVEEQVTETVEGQVAAEVAENVEKTFSREIDEITTKLDAVNERIDEQQATDGEASTGNEGAEASDAEREDESR